MNAMFRGSKRCRCPGSPGGRTAEGSRNGACTSSPCTGTARRSITSSATRTGAPAATASFRPYPALTVTCRVPAAVASSTRAAAVPERSSGTSSPAWLDVHGGHRHPGRVQQPGRCLLQDTGQHGVPGRPVQQPPQQLEIQTRQPQRHHPVTAILGRHCVGEHDEVPAVHGTAVRRPSGPGISKHDTDNRHDGPPEDSESAHTHKCPTTTPRVTRRPRTPRAAHSFGA